MNSWKTTFFGIMGAIGGAVTLALHSGMLNPADFPHWLGGLATLLTVISPAGLGFAARDNDKTSEQVGAGKPSGGPPSLPLLLLLAVLFYGTLTSVMCSGCSSTPQRIAYNTLSASEVTVSAAMGAWGDYVKQSHPPIEQEQKVADAYKKYQLAMTAVIDATQLAVNLAASSSTNSTAASANTELYQQQAANALAELVELVKSFGATLK